MSEGGGGNEQEEDEILLPTDYRRYEVAAGSSGAILPPFRGGGGGGPRGRGGGRKETKWTMLFPPAQSADLPRKNFTTLRTGRPLFVKQKHSLHTQGISELVYFTFLLLVRVC